MQTFTLKDQEYIELNKLLKLLQLAETGGAANEMITEGAVEVNGQIETQKRKKLRKNDKIVIGKKVVVIK